MKRRIAIAAAIIIIVAFFSLSYWGVSIDGANTAFAAVKEAVMKMPCVHLVIDGHQNQVNYRRECWISFESGTKYEKWLDGTISSIDTRTHKKSVYDPDTDKISVSYYRVDDEPVEKMDSSDKLLSGLLDEFDTWDAKVTIKQAQHEGMEVDVYNAELLETEFDNEVKITGTMELIVDRFNNLPISGKLSGWATDGTLLLDATLAFDYPANDIENIYALGVPESVEIIDNAPEVQADIVLDRLNGRVEKGFGNSVAVLTESAIKDDQTTVKRSIRLYGQKDNSTVNTLYWLHKKKQSRPPSSEMDKINSWPIPDVNEVLELGYRTLPGLVFASNGTTAWQGRYENTSGTYKGAGEIIDKQEIITKLPQWSLSGKVWPGSHLIDFDRADIKIKVELVQSSEYPQYVGIHVDETFVSNSYRFEWTYWIDPSRDDMLVEIIYIEYGQDKESVEHRTKYIDHAQLGNGQWYPTHWQTTITEHSNGNSKQIAILEYYLQIYHEMVLSDWWFTTLVNNLKAQNPTVP